MIRSSEGNIRLVALIGGLDCDEEAASISNFRSFHSTSLFLHHLCRGHISQRIGVNSCEFDDFDGVYVVD